MCNILHTVNSFGSNDYVAVIDGKPMPGLRMKNRPRVYFNDYQIFLLTAPLFHFTI